MKVSGSCFQTKRGFLGALMINITIEKRREHLKKIYNALNASPISLKYTPEKIKDIAITSEYECCENSKSESEYYSGIVQIIQRILGAVERSDIDREGMCRTPKQRPVAVGNTQVFFSNTMNAAGTFSTFPGMRGQKTPQSHLSCPMASVNNMYASRTLESHAKTGPTSNPVFSRHNYPSFQTAGPALSQEDFVSQYFPSINSYQRRQYAGPQLLRHPDLVRSSGTQSFRRWDVHDGDQSTFHNMRVAAPVRGSVLHSSGDVSIKERPKNAARTHVFLSEANVHARGDTPQTRSYPSAASSAEDGSIRSDFFGTNILQKDTKENAFKTPYSYARINKESQKVDVHSVSSTAYVENASYDYEPRHVNTPVEPNADTSDTQVASLLSSDSLGADVFEFDLRKKLLEVVVSDDEKKVISSRLCEFHEELLGIEADLVKHVRLGCSPDLSKKLETVCKIIRAQIEYIGEHRYFLREAFIDIAIEKVRKYAVLAREELRRAQKNLEAYDFPAICARVAKAFRRMKDTNSSFVFCLDTTEG